MKDKPLDGQYWEDRYRDNLTGWDVGYATPPLMDFITSCVSKDAKIMIPGCGYGHEAEALYKIGYQNLTVIDLAPSAFENLKNRYPDFPEESLVLGDFFEHRGQYDVILEQTFFCALNPNQRPKYAKKMHELLAPGGRLAGVLFKFPLTEDGPPFGGSREEYEGYFSPWFEIAKMEECYNSIGPRKGNELFIHLQKLKK